MNIDFDKYFNDETIDLINNIVSKQEIALLGQKRYLELIDKEILILNKFDLFNNREINDLIFEYDNLKYKQQHCYIWLAFYIGFYYGKKSKRQKDV